MNTNSIVKPSQLEKLSNLTVREVANIASNQIIDEFGFPTRLSFLIAFCGPLLLLLFNIGITVEVSIILASLYCVVSSIITFKKKRWFGGWFTPLPFVILGVVFFGLNLTVNELVQKEIEDKALKQQGGPIASHQVTAYDEANIRGKDLKLYLSMKAGSGNIFLRPDGTGFWQEGGLPVTWTLEKNDKGLVICIGQACMDILDNGNLMLNGTTPLGKIVSIVSPDDNSDWHELMKFMQLTSEKRLKLS